MRPVKIVFLLFPKTHLLDLSGPAQAFYEAGQLSGRPFRIEFAGTGDQIKTEQGAVFSHLAAPESIHLEKGDMICVPGFDFHSFSRGELDESFDRIREWLHMQRKKGVYLASICSGALALAKMGLLDHLQCTTHWKCLPYARTHFPRANFLDHRLYVFDQGVFTSAGMTAGIDMALALVEKWRNPLLAARTAQEMVINVRRAETREQQHIFLDFDNHFNAEVYKAQEILANRLDARFTIGDLAGMMNLSERHLARLFRRHTGQTIQEYRDRLRLQHAEQLLLNTEMFVKEIAVACGFEGSRQFIRLWNRHKQMPPGKFRKQTPAA